MYLIQVRRDTAAAWTSADPTLASGEYGYETDSTKLKIGDGTTAWTSLGYWNGGAGDVNGPASSTNNSIVRFDLATGKLIQGSGVIISDDDEVSEIATATFAAEYNEGMQTTPQTVDFGGANPAQKKLITLNTAAFVGLTLTFPAVGNYILRTVNKVAVTSLTIAVTDGVPYYPGATIDFKGDSGAINILSIYFDGTNAYIASIPDMSTTSESVNIT